MNTKHTPGPWVVTPTKWNLLDTFEISRIDKSEWIAQVLDDEANARLIAAAPELLEVLVEILPFAEEIINSNHPTWKKAKSAIAKATGEKEVAV
jgi:hypothetical protein